VGKSETFLKLLYLQNDKQQDGCRTNICWRLLFLMITKGWIGQVKFGMEVNCNNFTHYVQNNSSFKLFKHEAMIINSVSLLYCRCQNNAVRSIYTPWLAQYHRYTLTSLLAGLWRNRCWKFENGKHFFCTRKHADQFWHQTSILLNRRLCIFPG